MWRRIRRVLLLGPELLLDVELQQIQYLLGRCISSSKHNEPYEVLTSARDLQLGKDHEVKL
jgi:hypothetical protein